MRLYGLEAPLWTCAVCGTDVPGERNQDGSITPASRYWKGREMSEVYCGPECSLVGHQPLTVEAPNDES